MAFGLRFRLILIVIAAAAPALFLAWHTASRESTQAREIIEEVVVQLAEGVAREKEHAFRQTEIILRGLSALSAVRGGGTTCAAALSRARELYPDYVDFAIASASGQITCSARPDHIGLSVAGLTFVRAALMSGELSSGQLDAIPHTTTSGIPLALAMHGPTGEPDGVAMALLRTDHVDVASLVSRELGADVIEFDHLGRVTNTYPATVAATGSVIADFEHIRPHLAGGATLIELGDDHVLAVAPVPGLAGSDLYAAIRMEREDMYAHVALRMRGALIAILVTLLLAFVATRLLASGLVLRPVDRILAATRRFGTGDFGARAGPPYAAGELGVLARALDRTAETLARQEDAREKAVRALRRSESSYQALNEHAPYGIRSDWTAPSHRPIRRWSRLSGAAARRMSWAVRWEISSRTSRNATASSPS